MDRFITELGYQEIAFRVIAAIFIGGIIGYEREKNNRPAGFRTHILVCLGAAITSIIQDRMRIDVLRLAATQPEAMQAIKLDLGRLGAQVISGIGFLGAGSIMRERGTIEGLTTAAGIWATGCIGLAVGWGFYSLTLIATVAVIITLITLKKLEVSWIAKQYNAKISVQYKNSIRGEDILEMSDYLKKINTKVLGITKNEEEKTVLFTIRLKKNAKVSDIVLNLASYDKIEQVRKED
ncbi:MgtC/SapB family protein [Fusobacterium necrophorum]|uniref:Magnesium transporter MgtC n=2 Tax=Fusobacterium necrophorum TaxID=859 RepID=A0AB73BY37_9FUSO|nr:MgtC/SapB family protein [Fusobacterium necrophorum]AYZ73447.1 MgtC/SapB family protein [Fusobacterium necrophorum]AZW08556.1 MgtC/SapB family protein [Fusobacterium necrophorum subsp. necrophorum]KDE63212.1 magnesium transporter MgtC [Fusobacterium necrophorum BFTR-1]KDE63801.1 magnesium transporter MgtC [Fusobacterium necrophorum BL]KDE64139.1 magnesium transporter MgtC [Fusobacterium necrophorum DJ-1]